MALKPKRWQIAPPFSPADLGRIQRPGIHPILAQILYHRGFTDPLEAEAFLTGTIRPGDPFRMLGVAKAVERIRRAIKNKEPIAVYGDFDADGVTSTVLLTGVLRALGAVAQPYIPHRVDEGYGLNDDALIRLAKQGIKLVVTVDCGIRSLREVETGNEARLDMIVTDHHTVGPEVPRALAVINPKQPGCKYGESMLAGVGVTYKLAQALLAVAKAQDRVAPLEPDSLLDLVAIGTVADLVPLDRGENRKLVIDGLAQLRMARRLGIRAMLDAANFAPERLDAWAIGFVIGPRINAAGRLESAMQAYDLLATDDIATATEYALKLQALNERRQQLTREMQEYARGIAGVSALDSDVSLIFAADPNFLQGIVGLVAGRLTEEFYRPSIIIHYGEHESHGSCRSIPEFDITAALDECADLLIRHGGHTQAAGFALYNENLPHFRAQIMDIAARSLKGKPLQPSLDIDAELKLGQLDNALYEALRRLEPCGNAYPPPVLCSCRLRVIDARRVGRDESHLKLKLSDGMTEKDAIAFRFGEYLDELPPYVDVAYQLDMNEWNGSRRLELRVVDIRGAK